jgi:hypothetical protein
MAGWGAAAHGDELASSLTRTIAQNNEVKATVAREQNISKEAEGHAELHR